MARLSALFVALLLGGACAAALVSCGSGDDELLPGTTAEQIEANLDKVEDLAAAEDCFGAESAVAEVTAEVEELEGVDQRLKTALQEGTARLSELVGGCEEEEAADEEAEPSIESNVDAEEVEDEKKPKKEKPEKGGGEEPSEGGNEDGGDEGPALPPQSNGKGEENGKGGGPPPAETEPEETSPSGGVGPGVGVE